MIYFKKTTTNGTLYRRLDESNFIVTDVLEGIIVNSVSQIESESFYNQISGSTTEPPFVSSSQTEFESAKTTVLAALNNI